MEKFRDEDLLKLKNYALKLIAIRPRTHQELKQKLTNFSEKRKISSTILAKVIRELISQNLINDREFIDWWVNQRLTFKPKGVYALKKELLLRGISRQEIDNYFQDHQELEASEFNLAKNIIDKKIKHLSILPKETIKIKIRNILLQRGFNYEVINRVIDASIKTLPQH